MVGHDEAEASLPLEACGGRSDWQEAHDATELRGHANVGADLVHARPSRSFAKRALWLETREKIIKGLLNVAFSWSVEARAPRWYLSDRDDQTARDVAAAARCGVRRRGRRHQGRCRGRSPASWRAERAAHEGGRGVWVRLTATDSPPRAKRHVCARLSLPWARCAGTARRRRS